MYGDHADAKSSRGNIMIHLLSETAPSFSIGERVQLSPHLDAWMMGDHYGEVVKTGKRYVYVRCDRSGKTRLLSPFSIERI
jgi:hypothetical protein